MCGPGGRRRELHRPQHLTRRERRLPHAGHQVGDGEVSLPAVRRPHHGRGTQPDGERRHRARREARGRCFRRPLPRGGSSTNRATRRRASGMRGCCRTEEPGRLPQLRESAGRRDRHSSVGERHHGIPPHRREIDEAAHVGLRLGEQPGAAAEQRLARGKREVGTGRGDPHPFDPDEIHPRSQTHACVGGVTTGGVRD